MESDLHVNIKGVEEELASKIGKAVLGIINALDQFLDFRRMHRIVVTTDFAGELAELSNKSVSGKSITYTNEEYGIAIAKVLTFPLEEDFEIVPIINANAAALLKDDLEDVDEEKFHIALHLLHHELCHVHEGNLKIDALKPIILSHWRMNIHACKW